MRSLFRILSMAAMIAVIVACGQDEPQKTNPTPPPPPPVLESINSYTIMTYGCGGANLDEYYENVLEVVSQLDVPSNINIVGQMKWSNGYNSDMSDGRGNVSRFKYNHTARSYDNEVVGDNSFMIDDPNNLAEFVEWARSEAPADEYVIIFMGHGNAYHPGFEGNNTRGIMRDDEEISYLGLSAITEAFETADAHFGMVFMMCCLMNSIEYVTELEPYADYYLASSHVTSISGGEIYLFVEALAKMEQYNSMSLVEAVKYYIDQDYDLWWNQSYLTIDHTLTECSKIVQVNSAIREFTDIVAALYEEQAEIGGERMNNKYGFTTSVIDDALSRAYYPVNAEFSKEDIEALQWYRLDYAFDVVDVATQVAEATKFSEIAETVEKIKAAAAEAITYQRHAHLKNVDRVYYTVALVNKEQWASLDFENAGYEHTAFDEATGWSRLLKSNRATFMHVR